MVPVVFAVNGPKQLVIGSFNIHGSHNKLERGEPSSWLMEHDIVFLCETMTCDMINAPGLTVFIGNNSTTTSNRGGTALLVKRNIAKFIYDIDRFVNDQICFFLSFVSNVIFGGCYIPPSDSSYCDGQCFSNILEKCFEHLERDFILFSDLNSSLGLAIQT